MNTQTVTLADMASILRMRKIRPEHAWAAVATHIHTERPCWWRGADWEINPEPVPSSVSRMDRGDMLRRMARTYADQGPAEVLRTWGAKLETLLITEPEHYLTGNRQTLADTQTTIWAMAHPTPAHATTLPTTLDLDALLSDFQPETLTDLAALLVFGPDAPVKGGAA